MTYDPNKPYRPLTNTEKIAIMIEHELQIIELTDEVQEVTFDMTEQMKWLVDTE